MKNIYIDYDSTLVNFGEVFLKKFNKHYKQNFNLNELENFREEVKNDKVRYKEFMNLYGSGNIYENIEFFEGSKDFLKKLKERGFTIKIITSSVSGEQKEYKVKHIENNIKHLIDEVIHSNKKQIHTKNYVLVDDSLKNVKNHVENKESIGSGILCNFEGKKLTKNEIKLINENNETNKNKIIFTKSFDDLFKIIMDIYEPKKVRYEYKNDMQF